jgi:tRNA nucleotidyltransferase (CCA-adding enzyme)
MDNYVSVVNRALSQVKPSPSERQQLDSIVIEVRSLLNKSLLNNKVKADVVVGGSFARGTFLKGGHDVDFFIRFENKDGLAKFSEIVLSAFPKARKVMGSRTYFKVDFKGFEIELVPTLKISDPSDAENSMDASFFHIEYVNARLNDSMRDQVRLFKQFCKACGVYGAESHIGGFSGYVIELLVLHFKNFKEIIKFINIGSPSTFIDIEGYYESVDKALKALNVRKSITPLVIVDPVLPTRNASAGLTKNSFDRFILEARSFLRKPALSYFTVKERTVNDLVELAKKRGHPLHTHKFNVKDKPDVFLAKLGREIRKVKSELERNGFKVYDFGILDNGTVFFELVRDVLPLIKRVIGPPVTIDSKNFDAFIKNKAVNGPYVYNGRICFDVKRKETRAKPFLMRLLKEIKL